VSLQLRILQVDVPAALLREATAFWSGALGARPVHAPGGFVHLHDARSIVEVHLQPLDDGPARYHLDLEASATPTGPDSTRDAEVARLVGHGARPGHRSAAGYTTVRDPAELPLCVIDPDAAPRTPLAPERADRGHLHAIYLDVPARDGDAEVAFWAAALGASVGRSEGDYVPLDGVRGPGGPVLLVVQRIGGGARVHVDLRAADVGLEAQRLEALGATRVAAIETWITLADPAGNLLCVVPETDGD
jgi:catechol 2,3-dioxygenase-like lactoylglutathione lyase family enzyme